MGLLLLLVAALLLTINPSVDVSAADYGSSQPAGAVECSIAPYDAGLYGNDDPPGGEHSAAYSDEVAADCHSVNKVRFGAALGAAIVGVVLLGLVLLPGRRRASAGSSPNQCATTRS